MGAANEDSVEARIDALLTRWTSGGADAAPGRTATRAELAAIADAGRADGALAVHDAARAAAAIFDALPGDEALVTAVGSGPVEARAVTHLRWLAVAALAKVRMVAERDVEAEGDGHRAPGPYRRPPAERTRTLDDDVFDHLDGGGAADRIVAALDREMATGRSAAGKNGRGERLDELRMALEEMALAGSPRAALDASIGDFSGSIAVMRAVSYLAEGSVSRRPEALDALDRIGSLLGPLVGVSVSRDDLIARVVARLEGESPAGLVDEVADALATALAPTSFLETTRSLLPLSRAADEAIAATVAARDGMGWLDRLNVLWDAPEKTRWRLSSEAEVAAERAHREAVDEMYATFAHALEAHPGVVLQLELPRLRRAIDDLRAGDNGGIDGHAELVALSTDWCARIRAFLGLVPSAADLLHGYVIRRVVPALQRPTHPAA